LNNRVTDGQRRNRVKSKARLLVSAAALIGIIAAAVFSFYNVYVDRASEPAEPGSTETISVTIPSGAGTGRIAEILMENGLIKNSTVFKLKSKTKDYDGKYQAGHYSLSGHDHGRIMVLLLSARRTRCGLPYRRL
jgi:UPF0755 protein